MGADDKKRTDDEIRAEARKKISQEELQRQWDVGREVMRKYRNALRRLAQTEDVKGS